MMRPCHNYRLDAEAVDNWEGKEGFSALEA